MRSFPHSTFPLPGSQAMQQLLSPTQRSRDLPRLLGDDPDELFRRLPKEPKFELPGEHPDQRDKLLVLLVEDDPNIQDVYGIMLKASGYDVIVIGDGIEAVEWARERAPDIILMDINLPGQDGWEATKALKSDKRTRNIPVVGVSASAGPSFQRKALGLGFESYHAKPMSPTDLVAEVRRVLDHH